MAANRKLQAEIDKVLKKVEEGVELFDEITDKVYNASQQSLKEKYEGDLKKEIKKLQRLRDQIKTWIGSNDIKDKNALIESRKLIESKMEQFKICEKDTKTKAYSKEGLARDSKMDPKEQEKEEKRDWINQCLESLTELIDTIELEVDKLSTGKNAKNKNKKDIEMADNRIKKNKWHCARLEQILRLLDADDLDLALLDDIKDGVDYYIESAVDDDGALGIDDEFDIYEELDLDQVAGGPVSETKDEAEAESTAASTTALSTAGINDIASSAEEVESSKKVAAVPTSQLISGLGKQVRKEPSKQTTPTTLAKPTNSPATGPTAAPNTKSSVALAQVAKKGEKSSQEDQSKNDKAVKPEPQASIWGNVAGAQKLQQQTISGSTAESQPSPSIAPPVISFDAQLSSNAASGHPMGGNNGSNSLIPPPPPQQPLQTAPSQVDAQAGLSIGQSFASQTAQSNNRTFQTISSSINSSTIPPRQNSNSSNNNNINNNNNNNNSSNNNNNNNTFPPEMVSSLMALKNSMQFVPVGEAERSQSFVPKYPYVGHPAFPTLTPSVIENPNLFEKLPTDSLFLAFYHQQGSYQQFLAAKQLKKQSWRYHKKYMTWFQRHDEPKVTTDEYEEGTYVYFDYESGWCPRLKSEFKFEYCYLEDSVGKS